MSLPIPVMLGILCVALAGHYIIQRRLLRAGWEAEHPKPIINRLMINGAILIITAIVALSIAKPPYGLFGILIFIEGAVSVTFGRKLSRK